MDEYDVIIIGAGPAGLFAADELVRSSQAEVCVVEKGLDLPERVAVRSGKQAAPEATSVMLEGFGGAGAFCDGKLTLTTEVGGHLHELVGGDQLFINHAKEAALLAVLALHKINHRSHRIMVRLLSTILAHRPLDFKPPSCSTA